MAAVGSAQRRQSHDGETKPRKCHCGWWCARGGHAYAGSAVRQPPDHSRFCSRGDQAMGVAIGDVVSQTSGNVYVDTTASTPTSMPPRYHPNYLAVPFDRGVAGELDFRLLLLATALRTAGPASTNSSVDRGGAPATHLGREPRPVEVRRGAPLRRGLFTRAKYEVIPCQPGAALRNHAPVACAASR